MNELPKRVSKMEFDIKNMLDNAKSAADGLIDYALQNTLKEKWKSKDKEEPSREGRSETKQTDSLLGATDLSEANWEFLL